MKKIYITCVVLSLIFVGVSYSKELRCDFNLDNNITSSDVAIFAAWNQSRKSTDLTFVQSIVDTISNGITVRRLPKSSDKISMSGDSLDTSDLLLLSAYLQSRKSSDFTFVNSLAETFNSTAYREMSVVPGTEIGSATASVIVTDIKKDP